MASPARIARHPIHPMLIPIPVGLFIFSLACDLAYRAGAAPLCLELAFWTMVGGVIGALLAAFPGLIDFLSIRDRRAWQVAAVHMSINLLIVVMYVVNIGMRIRSGLDAPAAFALSIAAVALLVVSGWLGWSLVYEHGVGLASPSEIAIAARRKDHAA